MIAAITTRIIEYPSKKAMAMDWIGGKRMMEWLPIAMDRLTEFAKDCANKKINFIGICCGAEPHHVREMAVALGKKPIAYKYYPDMSKHYAHGNDPSLKKHNTDAAKTL